MASLSVMAMTNYPAALHMNKLYSPVRRDMTAVAALTKFVDKAVSVSSDEHWNYCHEMLPKVSKSFSSLVLQIAQPQLRDSICNMYLLLRNLDTIEDDMDIPAEVKAPLLYNYHRCLSDNNWKFICGTNADRELTKGHHHIQAAFMSLDNSSQEIIYEVAKKMSQGMAKFLPKEIKTMSEYEKYTEYVHGLFMSGSLRLAHALIGEDLVDDSLSLSMACLHQKRHTIHSYHEDVTELPRRKMYWVLEIWSKYVNKLEDFQDEENSVKAVQLLNEMITNALTHVEDCLEFMSKIQDPLFFRFYAVPRIASIGELALCYNNLQVFRTLVKPKSQDLKTRIFDMTNTMADVYGAFYDISCLLESKVNNNDPHAVETLNRLGAIKQKCMDSGTLDTRKSTIFKSIQDII
ncbi:Squalene synthase [Heracleum sosnowskyi]|uniref:Squalene synthase n=1 Tax=Heracleum sosnowskyi TaxID=360622 RepID=A0AAD8HNI1_9APIA|nr:Squalene synthase [Heracleum sosnowskyi]